MATDPDSVSGARAAEACGLRYSDEFNRVRWSLEEAVDPATQLAILMPPRLAVPYLTALQIKRLDEHDRQEHLAHRAERIKWTKQHWMRVPCWGGIRLPGAEWRYSLRACAAWRDRMQYAEVGR
jgi:hypothetical protein